jgi:hypothetical protein
MSNEMVRRDFGGAYVPTTYEQAMALAQSIASTAMVPEGFRGRPAEVFAAMAYGAELGMGPMMALRSVHVIKGTPVLKAEARLARVVGSPLCEYFTLVESTDTRAEWETLRRGAPKPVRMAYTIEQARRAGQTRNPTWVAHPEAMLRWAAARALTSAVYPDVVGGLPTEHDVEDMAHAEREATDARAEAGVRLVERRMERLRSGAPAPSPVADVVDVTPSADGRTYRLHTPAPSEPPVEPEPEPEPEPSPKDRARAALLAGPWRENPASVEAYLQRTHGIAMRDLAGLADDDARFGAIAEWCGA